MERNIIFKTPNKMNKLCLACKNTDKNVNSNVTQCIFYTIEIHRFFSMTTKGLIQLCQMILFYKTKFFYKIHQYLCSLTIKMELKTLHSNILQ